MKRIRVTITLLFVVSILAVLGANSYAYPPFVGKAAKFGAKDCKFCHVKAEGGDNHNARGKWLLKEKTRRNADAVDPEWLAEYKPAKGKKK